MSDLIPDSEIIRSMSRDFVSLKFAQRLEARILWLEARWKVHQLATQTAKTEQTSSGEGDK